MVGLEGVDVEVCGSKNVIKTSCYTYFWGLFIQSSLLCFFPSLICTIMIKKSLSITFLASQQKEINKFSGRIFSNPKIPITHWVIKEPQHRCSKSFNRSQNVNRGIQLLVSVEAKPLKCLGSKKRERKHKKQRNEIV